MVDFTGTLRTVLKEETLDISRAERVTRLTIAGVATPIGNRIGSVWQIVVLVLEEMLSVVAMESSMLSLTRETTTLLTQGRELCVTLLSKIGHFGLCSRGTWLFS